MACYAKNLPAIFVRANLVFTVERCAIAHEIVHHQFNDPGNRSIEASELRADRIAASRLISQQKFLELQAQELSFSQIALELQVTARIMSVYLVSLASEKTDRTTETNC